MLVGAIVGNTDGLTVGKEVDIMVGDIVDSKEGT